MTNINGPPGPFYDNINGPPENNPKTIGANTCIVSVQHFNFISIAFRIAIAG